MYVVVGVKDGRPEVISTHVFVHFDVACRRLDDVAHELESDSDSSMYAVVRVNDRLLRVYYGDSSRIDRYWVARIAGY